MADGKTGGHVNLSVKIGEFFRTGEAKKDGDFHEGFLQLNTWYVPASGNFAHNQDGLTFYLIANHSAQGLTKVRTMGVALHHKPRDKSAAENAVAGK